jgi:hypothetical protein
MTIRRLHDKLKEADGSMMLEYVIMLSVGVVFFVFVLHVFEPGKGFTDDLGKPFVAYFQRVLTGISLPIP